MAFRPDRYKIWDGAGSTMLSEELGPIGWCTPPDRGTTARTCLGLAWLGLAAAFERTGLWPVVGGPAERSSDPERRHAIEPPSRDHGDEASNVLQHCWGGMRLVNRKRVNLCRREGRTFLRSDRAFLQLRTSRSFRWLDRAGGGQAVVVPALESWLSPQIVRQMFGQLIGWTGTQMSYLADRDISAVLRSWEDLYGAVLYELGQTTMTLLVARPPKNIEAATTLMEERHLLCYDNFCSPDRKEPLSKDEYAERLINDPAWDCRWG